MSKTFDELMKVLEEKGEIPDDVAKKLIEEHGPLSDEEKKQVAAAIKMKKALTSDEKKEEDKGEEKDKDAEKDKDKKDAEVTMDDYLQALSVLDSEDAGDDEKEQAKKVKEQFEGQ
jgi:hypothetical protein